MASASVLESLKTLEFTQDLEMHHLEKLASISTQVTFSEGATLFREEDKSELVYLIEEGDVSIVTQVPGHGQVTILTIGPGQILGWSSLFPPQRKTAGAIANEPTRVVAINATQLRELSQTDHELGNKIMWRVAEVISERLRAARRQLLDMFEPSRNNQT
ncbi:MAG: cyclic nucleotide-binding domain-containing protein [Anaerolineales bacterium]|nr:cyclic nucleotide-binding domain-containing protein [Anaerolineales bacterium]